MAQSLSKLFVHIIFHIKTSSVEIRKEDEKDLYAYIGAIIKDNASIPIQINGTGDHVHILCVLSKNMAIARLVEEIKGNSSRWIKTLATHYSKFAWQGGYGGFSVSPSVVDRTKIYIENQEKNHQKMTFHEEYMAFLNEYGIDCEEQYVFRD